MLRRDSPVSFGTFVLDPADGRLVGAVGPVHLGRKAFRVLEALVGRPGRLLTKEDLFQTAWDGVAVSESVLTTVIKELRHALGDDSRNPRFIQSVYGRGYRFIAPVAPASQPIPTSAADPDRLAPHRAPTRRLALALGMAGLGAGLSAATATVIDVGRSRPPAASPEIEAIIAQARYAMGQKTLEGQNVAIGLYRRVVELSPGFADGWGLLGMAYSIVSHHRERAEGLALRARARAAAGRALALDAGNGLGESALAYELPLIGHWLERDGRFDRAVADRPDHVDVLTFVAATHQYDGRLSDALAVYDRVRRPLCPVTYGFCIRALWSAGRIEETDRALADATTLFPTLAHIWFERFHIALFGGRPDEALALVQNPAGRPPDLDDGVLAGLEAQAKTVQDPRGPQAEQTLAAMVRDARRSAWAAEAAISLAAAVGAVDTAFTIADAYFFSRGHAIPDLPNPGSATSLDQRQTRLLFEPPTALMRADSRFEPLVAAIGLDAYWRASGKSPDYRRAL